MDKQQAAENFASFFYGTGDRAKAGFIAGWEAHEAQNPKDALSFAEWVSLHRYRCGTDGIWLSTVEGDENEYTTAELYKLFNPSGAAPAGAAGPVWVKGEYDRLYAQVKSGKRTPCYVDYHWRGDNSILRDIASIGPENLEPSARGIGYGCMRQDKDIPEVDRFIEMCKSCNVEWLDESAPQVFTREQVREIIADSFINIRDGSWKGMHNVDQYLEINYPPSNK